MQTQQQTWKRRNVWSMPAVSRTCADRWNSTHLSFPYEKQKHAALTRERFFIIM